MARFEAVLFDLDGTLLDSVALILSSYHHTLARHGLAPQSDAAILEGLGVPLEAQLARWVKDAARMPAMIETYRTYSYALHDAMAKPYPGVSEVVHALRERGAKLALVTSKRREGTRKGLALLGLDAAFDVLVCADDVTRAKPHPEPVERALERLGGVEPRRAVFVGDSTHDMESGRAAGVHTAAVLWGPFTRAALAASAPDSFVETAAELRALLVR